LLRNALGAIGRGSAEGMTIIEVRIVDVTKRYGFNEYTLKKWDAIFKLKEYFVMCSARAFITV
jgi:hypothetical protein